MYSPTFDTAATALYFLRPLDGVSELFSASLPDGRLQRVVAPAGGGDREETLTLEEKLRRERTRQLAVGITSFVLLPGGRGLVYPQGGDLYLVRPTAGGAAAPAVLLVSRASGGSPGGGPLLDPKPSPTGHALAYVQDNEVYVVPLPPAGAPLPAAPAAGVAVTTGARAGGVTHGVADYLSAEELDRYTGYWWAPDGARLVFQETDERHVPALTIVHGGAEPASSTSLETHRYPFAGEANPRIRLGVVAVPDVSGGGAQSHPHPAVGAVTWLDLEGNLGRGSGGTATAATGDAADLYVPRVDWLDARRVVVQVLNREQSVLDYVCYDVAASAPAVAGGSDANATAASVPGALLHREVTDDADKGWINVSDVCLTLLPEEDESSSATTTTRYFLVGSERTGYAHLYLYSYAPTAAAGNGAVYAGVPARAGSAAAAACAATLVRAVTGGSWVVESAAYAPSSDLLFVGGTGHGPLQRHLYALPLGLRQGDGAAPATVTDPTPLRVSAGAGMHSAAVSHCGGYFADTLSSLHGPPSLCVYKLTTAATAQAAADGDAAAAPEAGGAGSDSGAGAPEAAAAAADGTGVTGGASAGGSPMAPAAATAGDATAATDAPPLTSSSSSSSSAPLSSLFGASAVLQAVVSFDGAGAYGEPAVAAAGSLRVTSTLLALGHGSLPLGQPPQPAGHEAHLRVLRAVVDAQAGRPRRGSSALRGSGGGGGGRARRGSSGGSSLAEDIDRDLKQLGSEVGRAVTSALSKASEAVTAGLLMGTTGMGGLTTSLTGALSSLLAAPAPTAAGAPSAGDGSAAPAALGDGAPQPVDMAAFMGVDGGAGGDANGADDAGVNAVANVASQSQQSAPPAAANGGGDDDTAMQSPSAATPVTAAAPPASTQQKAKSGQPAAANAAAPPAPVAPLIVRLTAADGVTPMYGSLLLPDPEAHGRGPWPTVISVYGGPHVQRVKAEWSTANEARAQALRRAGYLVATFDNRGSFRRGVAFERPLSRAMGTVEVADQLAGLAWLTGTGLADARRVGVYGWSYGGYMAAMMLLMSPPGTFAAAVAGAPVTDWRGYDTAYTERYMSTPQRNPRGYEAGCVMSHVAPAMRRPGGLGGGRLLLVHGLIDENVHVRHSWRLVAEATRAGLPYDLLVFPGERHVPREPAGKAYMEARIADFFAAALLDDKR